LRAFFEGGGFATQVRQNFTGEMQRAGDQNRIRFRAGKRQSLFDSWSDEAGE
jgi:hypothetical protein